MKKEPRSFAVWKATFRFADWATCWLEGAWNTTVKDDLLGFFGHFPDSDPNQTLIKDPRRFMRRTAKASVPWSGVVVGKSERAKVRRSLVTTGPRYVKEHRCDKTWKSPCGF